MEPVAASSQAPVLRTGSLSPSQTGQLAAVLREGRILSGRILSQVGDGLILALGRQRVPAQSSLALEVGRPLLFRVERSPAGILLHVLGGADAPEPELAVALRRVIGNGRPLGEALRALRALTQAPGATGKATGPTLPEGARAGLERLVAQVPHPNDGPESLRTALQQSGLRYEAALFGALRDPVDRSKLDGLRANLKAELLRLLGEFDEGPLRESVSRTLAGLEAEQLLNLARQRAGEPLLWSLPFFDGAEWATARLLLHPDAERGEGQGRGEEEETERLVFGISFSNTGPVRADIALSPSLLTIRLAVVRRSLAQRIEADLPRLSERLRREERRVQLSVRVEESDRVDLGAHPYDVDFLRKNSLVDRSA